MDFFFRSWFVVALACKEQIDFRGSVTKNEILFLVKLRSSYWINTPIEGFSGSDASWWSNPSLCSSTSSFVASAFAIKNLVSHPPHPGFLKFNIDGSSKGNLSLLGCEGVLRNETGSICAIFFCPIGSTDASSSELLALFHALDLFSKSAWKNKVPLIVEIDS
ncbi:hypothetical protein REPUB_Repub11eG0046200 [Reevesia pubescens]